MPQDLRDGFRALLRDRVFTFLAITLLALTVGATITVYAIVEAVVLRPLAIADQERVVVMWESNPAANHPVVEVGHGSVHGWKPHTRALDAVAVFSSVNWSITVVDGREKVSTPYASVSATFFPLVGTAPLLGRTFTADDETGFDTRVAVLSHGLWMRRYGGDPGVLGRSLTVQDEAGAPLRSIEIVGVMPAAFDFPRGAELWLPAAPELRKSALPWNADPEARVANYRVFYGLGRLAPGHDAEAAQRELTQVLSRVEKPRGGETPPVAVLTPVQDYLLGPSRPVLVTLLAGAALMLLIACTNIAGLQVTRAARQDRALAIRLALGASRWRLVRVMAIESLLLSLAAAAGALFVAWGGSRLMVSLAPIDVPRLDAVTLASPGVFAAAALAIFAGVVLCACWPAIFAGRLDAGAVLAHGARAAAHPRERRLQRALVAAQVAIAVVLLAGAMLFVRSVQTLDRTALGFQPANLLTLDVYPDTSDVDRSIAFYDALLTRVEAIPQVTAAGAIYLRPLSGPIGMDTIPIFEGQNPRVPDTWLKNPRANLEVITPGYFTTMGTRLLDGRFFTRYDVPNAEGVIIINESAARRYFPGKPAVGQRILAGLQRLADPKGAPRYLTVVGVVEDVRYRGLTDQRLDLYLPAQQSLQLVKHVMVRTTGDPLQVAAQVRAVAREIDPQATVDGVTTMSAMVERAAAPWRFAMRVLSGFAMLAAFLATIGLGATVSLAAALRRRELGIRSALGATRAQLGTLIAREGVWLVGAGALAGVVGAIASGRAVAGVLVGITPHDPTALSVAVAVAAAAGLLACCLPALRAARTDPLLALKSDH